MGQFLKGSIPKGVIPWRQFYVSGLSKSIFLPVSRAMRQNVSAEEM